MADAKRTGRKKTNGKREKTNVNGKREKRLTD
jgi:hypothetical protein